MNILNLSIGYKRHILYKNINLELPNCGIISFVGDNGSGKSTLYKTLLGIIKPISGNIPLKFQSRLAVISDYVHLPLEPKVKDVLNLLGKHKINIMKEHYNKLHNYIISLQKQRLSTLSSGQLRIVEIYTALCSGKDIIILDEASNSLDFKNKELFLAQVKELSSKILFLHTDHELDNVVFLNGDIYGLFKSQKKIEKYNGENNAEKIKQFLQYGVTNE